MPNTICVYGGSNTSSIVCAKSAYATCAAGRAEAASPVRLFLSFIFYVVVVVVVVDDALHIA